MNSSVYFGSLVTDRVGSFTHAYFLPQKSPFKLNYKESTWERMMLAQGALWELKGATRVLRPSEISFRVSHLQEALASSRIEGTQSTLAEVLEAEMDDEIRNADIEEVMHYQGAMDFAISQLAELPVSRRLACKTHEVLMQGRRGFTKTPGIFRKTPVWIGSYDSTPESAKFIPPLAHHLDELFADWELFANDHGVMPLVAHIAWAHYQFETIHPFLDGNGRIGRILIEVMLISKGALKGPYLGISKYIERYRDEYLDVLDRVRTKGDVDSLLRYFSAAIETSALDTVSKIESLIKLKDEWLEGPAGSVKHIPQLVDVLLAQPIVSVAYVRQKLDISQPTVSKLMRSAEALGLVVSRGQSGRGRKETWIAQRVWDIISPLEPA